LTEPRSFEFAGFTIDDLTSGKPNETIMEIELLGKVLQHPDFRKYLKTDQINLVDLGCGNGTKAAMIIRNLHDRDVFYTPLDISRYMIAIAKSNLSSVFEAFTVESSYHDYANPVCKDHHWFFDRHKSYREISTITRGLVFELLKVKYYTMKSIRMDAEEFLESDEAEHVPDEVGNHQVAVKLEEMEDLVELSLEREEKLKEILLRLGNPDEEVSQREVWRLYKANFDGTYFPKLEKWEKQERMMQGSLIDKAASAAGKAISIIPGLGIDLEAELDEDVRIGCGFLEGVLSLIKHRRVHVFSDPFEITPFLYDLWAEAKKQKGRWSEEYIQQLVEQPPYIKDAGLDGYINRKVMKKFGLLANPVSNLETFTEEWDNFLDIEEGEYRIMKSKIRSDKFLLKQSESEREERMLAQGFEKGFITNIHKALCEEAEPGGHVLMETRDYQVDFFDPELKAAFDTMMYVTSNNSNQSMYTLLGQTLGNFTEKDRKKLLRKFYDAMNEEDMFLVGVELRPQTEKRIREIEGYYERGSPCEELMRFSMRSLGVPDELVEYDAEYNRDNHTIEMHFTAKEDFALGYNGRRITKKKGDRIPVASSFKFDREELMDDMQKAGFSIVGYEEHTPAETDSEGKRIDVHPKYAVIMAKKEAAEVV
jgi:uncharacterized SAM-dependent methyltransferase